MKITIKDHGDVNALCYACKQMNPNLQKHLNLSVENFTQKPKNTKHEKPIAAQIEIVKHHFITAWQMLNDNHNNTGSQAVKLIRN